MPAADLRAHGDRDLYERLLKEREITSAIERFEKQAKDSGARRQLLGTAMRLAPAMAPDVHSIMEDCRGTLRIDLPVETYVIPSAAYNAAAVRPERGLLLILLSSSLLEAFEPDELKFVVGHELGHHLFEHHRIPVGALLGGTAPIGAALALQLFAWQRYAEISSDRAGLICAGSLDPAARALFKLASGLRGGRIRIDIEQFLSQVRDLREESVRSASADESPRGDWFATHPFSPLRVQAVELAARSVLLTPKGIPLKKLEAQIHELMALMDPSYLHEQSEAAEAMRRLLLAGAILIASASSASSAKALKELERLLGPGSLPSKINPEAMRNDLAKRVARVNEVVPQLQRAQIVRDLCVIARADQHLDEAELNILYEIAAAVGVDASLVTCSTTAAAELD
jgi:hypothetical protein